MTSEEQNDSDPRPTGDVLLVKGLAILFVLAVYVFILLKILVLN